MAGDPTIALAVTPASPKAGDGVLFEVTGPAASRFADSATKMTSADVVKIQIKDNTGRVRVESPVFTQKNRLGVPSEIMSLVPSGSPSGGYVTFSATVRQPYNPGNPESAAGLGVDETLAATAHIIYAASDDDVTAAVAAAWGTHAVKVSGGKLGVDTLVFDFGGFGGPLDRRDVNMTVDSHLTGGAVALTEATGGGVEQTIAGGPLRFGPIQFAAGVYTADVVYDYVSPDDDSGDKAGDSLLSGATTFTVLA